MIDVLLRKASIVQQLFIFTFSYGDQIQKFSPILDYLTGLLRIEAMREDEADDGTKELLRAGKDRNH